MVKWESSNAHVSKTATFKKFGSLVKWESSNAHVSKTATFKKFNFSTRFLELTSSAIARMWYGSNPQHPPIYLTPKS